MKGLSQNLTYFDSDWIHLKSKESLEIMGRYHFATNMHKFVPCYRLTHCFIRWLTVFTGWLTVLYGGSLFLQGDSLLLQGDSLFIQDDHWNCIRSMHCKSFNSQTQYLALRGLEISHGTIFGATQHTGPGLGTRHCVFSHFYNLSLFPPLGSQVRIPLSQLTAITFLISIFQFLHSSLPSSSILFSFLPFSLS